MDSPYGMVLDPNMLPFSGGDDAYMADPGPSHENNEIVCFGMVSL